MIGYSDSDFAGDEGDRKSTSGHIFFLGEMAISWSSQKQSIVALSSCEAEYIAATGVACQALWMKRLISELRHEEQKRVKLMVDNQSAITLSKNPVHYNRTKHIDTRYHFIRQCIEDKNIEIIFTRTEDRLADIFTKALGRMKLQEMRSQIGVTNIRTEELEQGGE